MGAKFRIPVRFWIGLMVFFTTYINYTTRVNMSISIVSMTGKKEKKMAECLMNKHINQTSTSNSSKELPNFGPRYDWDENIQGLILSSYFWGYCISSLPGGVLADMLGSHKVIFWACVVSAILNSLSHFGAQIHYSLLIVCRMLLGLMAGPVFPALQNLISKWAPPAEKGKFVAGLMGNTLGTCVTWPLVGTVTAAWGWSWGFHIVTVQIVVFCVIFFFVASDTPDNHKFISAEERDYIKEAQGASVSKKKTSPPYFKILKSIPIWILTILHFGNLYGLYVQLTMVPKFMTEVIGFNLKEAGGLSVLPHISKLFTGTAVGSLGDYLKKNKIVSNLFIRKFFILFSHIIPGILLMGISFVGCNHTVVIVLLTFSMAVNGAVVLTNVQNPQDLAPNFAGTIFGIISFIGGTSGFMVPSITAAFIKDNSGTQEWGYSFILGGTIYCVCGMVFILFGTVQEQSWNRKADETAANETPQI